MAFFTAFDTSLNSTQLAAKRRKLATLLKGHGIELTTLRVDDKMLIYLVLQGKGVPVVAIDDAHPLPNDAPWLTDLTPNVVGLPPLRRPQVIYVTQKANAEGTLQALRHPVVRCYVKRDGRGKWVEEVVEAVLDVASQVEQYTPPPVPDGSTGTVKDLVGASRPFRDAIEQLQQVIEAPYGLVSGPAGVGKMFLIRRLWQATSGKSPLIVVPCASFFKDYYVGGRHIRFGGGREAVDQLAPYLREAHRGMLVLHHVEQLPGALQEELAIRLTDSSGDPDAPLRMPVVHPKGLTEYAVRVLATSTFPPEQLRQTGRLNAELAVKLRKRHVRIPSLKQRGPEDVRLLCEDLLRRISIRQRLEGPPALDERVVSILTVHDWPENISDLVRVLEHALRHCRSGTIGVSHLPKDVTGKGTGQRGPTLDEIVADAQRTAIENALEQTDGSVRAAAELLGRNEKALYGLMKKLEIRGERRKK